MAQDKAILKMLPTLVSKNVFQDSIPAIDVFDVDLFESRIGELKNAFPEVYFMHTIAIKANPIRGIIQFASKYGLGTETASICETLHSLSLGIEPAKIVYGSPCKTKVNQITNYHMLLHSNTVIPLNSRNF